jgi:hypothetical protein
MAKKVTGDKKLTTVATSTSRGYSIDQWAGRAHYQCTACPFDTLNLDAMLDHQVQKHSPVADLQEPAVQPANQDAPAEPGEIAQEIFEVNLQEVDNAQDSTD